MSPLEFLASQFGQMLPAGAMLRSISIEFPDGSLLTSTLVPASAAPKAPMASAPAIVPNDSTAGRAEEQQHDRNGTLKPRERDYGIERVARFRKEHGGDAALKRKQWAPIAGIAERELCRAIKHGALRGTKKGDDRDHSAITITADDMHAYLAIIDAVKRGNMDRPAWWKDVRGSGKAKTSKPAS